MRAPAKAFVIGLVAAVTFSLGAAPAMATPEADDYSAVPAQQQPATAISQTLDTTEGEIPATTVDPVLSLAEAQVPHNYDVDAAIKLAESEVGTSRATGWSQPGECIMSAQRWVRAGGGKWEGGGNPVSNYDNAVRVPLEAAAPGDVIQYENIDSPTSWIAGVHTVLITGVNKDGTFTIIESNNPGGSGLVSKDEKWTPAPPEGFQAAVWRF
ncbi:MAG: CHAP domain-containing protein [Leucobacter sp.]